jgi:hypothetical protein
MKEGGREEKTKENYNLIHSTLNMKHLRRSEFSSLAELRKESLERSQLTGRVLSRKAEKS